MAESMTGLIFTKLIPKENSGDARESHSAFVYTLKWGLRPLMAIFQKRVIFVARANLGTGK
jgi:hypothetical protein